MVMEESISIWKLDGESTDIVLSIISDSRETTSSEVKKKLFKEESSRKISLSTSGFPNFHLSFQRSSVIEFLNLKLQISKLSCPTLESANNNLLFIWLDLRDQVTLVANSILTKKVREDNGR